VVPAPVSQRWQSHPPRPACQTNVMPSASSLAVHPFAPACLSAWSEHHTRPRCPVSGRNRFACPVRVTQMPELSGGVYRSCW
jgi:hypothetical protein